MSDVETPPGEMEGYCYLLLLSSTLWVRAAAEIGEWPTVADVRRFVNSHANPLSSSGVSVTLSDNHDMLHWHVAPGNLSAFDALGAMDKTAHVGGAAERRFVRADKANGFASTGLPDGVSEEFPADWIPAKRDLYRVWGYLLPGQVSRILGVTEWLGEVHDNYEPRSSVYTRVKWTLKADPVGPVDSTFTLVRGDGHAQVLREWTSYVAPIAFYHDWQVRGVRVFAELFVWRPARVTTTPGAPLPTPPADEDGGHGDLFGPAKTLSGIYPGMAAARGYCYLEAFRGDSALSAVHLGPFPKAADLKRFMRGVPVQDRNGDAVYLLFANNLYHVQLGGAGPNLWSAFEKMVDDHLVGSTQAPIVPTAVEDVHASSVLSVRPKGASTLLHVPFATVLTTDKPYLMWDLRGGRKLGSLLGHFESAELVSLRIRATITGGDNDTLLSVAADGSRSSFADRISWVSASHSLIVSGNVNGATAGEMQIGAGDSFGAQLKGAVLGNDSPVIQALFETSTKGEAYLKIMLTVRVAGYGNPVAIILPTRKAPTPVGAVEEDFEEEYFDSPRKVKDEPSSSSKKAAGK